MKPDAMMDEVDRILALRGVDKITAGEFKSVVIEALRNLGVPATDEDVELQWDPEAENPLRLYVKPNIGTRH